MTFLNKINKSIIVTKIIIIIIRIVVIFIVRLKTKLCAEIQDIHTYKIS